MSRRNVFFCTMDVNREGSERIAAIREGGCWYQKSNSPENFHFICNPYQYAGTTYSFDLAHLSEEDYKLLAPIFTNTVISPVFVGDLMSVILYKDDDIVVFIGEAIGNVKEEKSGS